MSSQQELAMAALREFSLPNPNLHQGDYEKWQSRIEYFLNSGAVEAIEAAAGVIGGTTDIREDAGFIDGLRPGVILITKPIEIEAKEYAIYSANGFERHEVLEGLVSETRYLSVLSDSNSLLITTGVGRFDFKAKDYPDAKGWNGMRYNNDNVIINSLHTEPERRRLIDLMVTSGIVEQSAIPKLHSTLLS